MTSQNPPRTGLGAGLSLVDFRNLYDMLNNEGHEIDQRGNDEEKDDSHEADECQSSTASRHTQHAALADAPDTKHSHVDADSDDREDGKAVPEIIGDCNGDQASADFYTSAVEDLVPPLAALRSSPSTLSSPRSNVGGQSISTDPDGSVSSSNHADGLSSAKESIKIPSLLGSKLPPLSFARETYHNHHILSANSGPLTRLGSLEDPDPSLCPTSASSIPKALSAKPRIRAEKDEQDAEEEHVADHLAHWMLSEDFLADARSRERDNPFPGVDQDYGWNRARYGVRHIALLYEETGINFPEMVRIAQGFKEYSLWSQVQPWRLDDVSSRKWKRVFGKIFVGTEGEGSCRWVRKPGTWWGVRRGMFSPLAGVHRNKSFGDWVEYSTHVLWIRVDLWKQDQAKTYVYERGMPKQDIRPGEPSGVEMRRRGRERAKKPRVGERASTKVMSEEWRARRRAQEKKAGRWTDGTLRMDRMWAEFHWVLNVDEPLGAHWDSESEDARSDGSSRNTSSSSSSITSNGRGGNVRSDNRSMYIKHTRVISSS